MKFLRRPFFPILFWVLLCPWLSEAPAATLHHFGQIARDEVQPAGLGNERCRKNASRDAHAFIRKWGLAWKVPMSYVETELDGDMVKFGYIKPSHFVEFLINRTPELLLGGCPTVQEGQASLEAFWQAYRHVHPTHRLFHENHPNRSLSSTFAIAFHGDEGRGLKKGNTTILMMETCLGVDSWTNYVQGKSSLTCDTCELDEPTRKRIRGNPTVPKNHACFQTTNLKEHSFLTKFVLAALPRKEKKLLEKVMLEIVRDFNALFTTGVSAHGRQWFAACTGAKGDLKWIQHVGGLERCFSAQTAINKEMCHECMAGSAQLHLRISTMTQSGLQLVTSNGHTLCGLLLCHIPFEHEFWE